MLPKLTKKLIARVRDDMTTEGYSIIDITKYINQNIRIPWCESWLNSNSLPPASTLNWIRKLVEWEDKLLKASLPEENFCLPFGCLSVRKERPSKHRKELIDRPHEDGGWIRALVTIKGPTTVLCLKEGHISVPIKHAVFITAKERAHIAPTTLHYRPKRESERKLIVTGWYHNLKY